jgi:hypothetical protein
MKTFQIKPMHWALSWPQIKMGLVPDWRFRFGSDLPKNAASAMFDCQDGRAQSKSMPQPNSLSGYLIEGSLEFRSQTSDNMDR